LEQALQQLQLEIKPLQQLLIARLQSCASVPQLMQVRQRRLFELADLTLF